MNRKKWIQFGLGVTVFLLFILVLLVVFNFNKKTVTYGDPDIPVSEKTKIEFQNESSMEEKEIRDLVEEKRTELKDFFQNATFYNVSEVLDGYAVEENEKYLVVTESFLNTLKSLLTETTYNKYMDSFVEVTPSSFVAIEEKIYRGDRDIFDDLYTNSAIAMIDVNVENLILKHATNDKIEAYENIKLCETDNENFCKREDYFVLNLRKENEEWKIEEFQEFAEI